MGGRQPAGLFLPAPHEHVALLSAHVLVQSGALRPLSAIPARACRPRVAGVADATGAPPSTQGRLFWLRAHGATLFSPHLGSAVEETRREIELAAAAEVVRWLDGEGLAYRVN